MKTLAAAEAIAVLTTGHPAITRPSLRAIPVASTLYTTLPPA